MSTPHLKYQVPTPQNLRRILCVAPRYESSFGTFEEAFPLVGRVSAFMPPQGLLLVAAYFRRFWEVRFIDQNLGEPTDADFAWSDAVFLSGMHIQQANIARLTARAHDAGRVVCLGGPSVSAGPELYPEADYLHIGELGDATLQLAAALDRSVRRPARQEVLDGKRRFRLEDFPLPAYDLLPLEKYLLGSVQFSSGCPFQCEFCDIPALYGRNPRYKTPGQVLEELDALLESGCRGSVYFVDDNFIGNKKAALELLPHLVEWQQKNGYPFELACEATINIAREEPLLALMRQAYFTTVFIGIESPDDATLRSIEKRQNLSVPLLEAIERLNAYGIEVVSGIIIGLDNDQPDAAQRILQFVEASRIPMLTVNLLQALPKTPLWDRLKREGRLLENGDSSQETNVVYKLPYETVHGIWRDVVSQVYDPANLYRRFDYQSRHVYPHRVELPNSPQRVNARNILEGLSILCRIIWKVGVRAPYRRVFWNMAWPALKAGKIEDLIHIALVGHHLIEFTRKALRGEREQAFYAVGTERVPAGVSS